MIRICHILARMFIFVWLWVSDSGLHLFTNKESATYLVLGTTHSLRTSIEPVARDLGLRA